MDLQELLNKWNIKCDMNTLLSMWNESHRHYHTLDHLNDLIEQINEDKSIYTEKEYEKLMITSMFHDCVYDIIKEDNEELSASFFMECCADKSNQDILDIKQMIIDTKFHKASNKLSESFIGYDMNIVERDFEKLLEWEKNIYSEYSVYVENYDDVENYQNRRILFIESLLDKYTSNTGPLLELRDWVKENYTPEMMKM